MPKNFNDSFHSKPKEYTNNLTNFEEIIKDYDKAKKQKDKDIITNQVKKLLPTIERGRAMQSTIVKQRNQSQERHQNTDHGHNLAIKEAQELLERGELTLKRGRKIAGKSENQSRVNSVSPVRGSGRKARNTVIKKQNQCTV
jgi:hypothetical protein